MTTLELKGKSESMTRFKVVILSEIAILTDEGFNYRLNARTVIVFCSKISELICQRYPLTIFDDVV